MWRMRAADTSWINDAYCPQPRVRTPRRPAGSGRSAKSRLASPRRVRSGPDKRLGLELTTPSPGFAGYSPDSPPREAGFAGTPGRGGELRGGTVVLGVHVIPPAAAFGTPVGVQPSGLLFPDARTSVKPTS